MATPTTLLELATQQRDDVKAEVAKTQQELADTQTQIRDEREKLTNASNEQSVLEKKAEAIRQKLPAVPTTADGEALLDTLQELSIQIRARQAEVLDAGAKLAEAQAGADRAQARFSAASGKLASAETHLRQVAEADKQRKPWKTALSNPPLVSLNTDADAALTATPFTDAEARINLDLPEKLRKRAQQRREDEAKRLVDYEAATDLAEAAVLKERATNGGLTGDVAELRRAFLRAQAAAQHFADHARGQFDQALSALKLVADKTRFPLTSEASERLNDSELKDDRESAADAEKDLDDKRKAVDDAQTTVDEEILKALAAGKNPETEQDVINAKNALKTAEDAYNLANADWRKEFIELETKIKEAAAKEKALAEAVQKAVAAKASPDTDPDVTQAKAELQTAQAGLKKAEDDYKKSKHGRLHAWAAAVPDATWRLFEQFEEAKATLNRLKEADPAKLKTDLEKAETDYVKELLKLGASDNILDQLTTEHARRNARQQHAAATAPVRLSSALRGDR